MENSKNIFVISTIDPSQVYLVKSTNALGLTSNNPEFMEHYGSGTHNQHVYITNKEPYDRGDWCIDIEAGEIFKVAEVKEYSGIVRSDTDTYVYDACAKIVITSDPKLVADGVAGIDIEFLRLLKDKKLDEISTVEVEKTPLLSNNGRALFGYKYTPIILPKQEPKQDLEKEMFELEQELDIPSNLRWHNSNPEQETKKHIVILAGEDAVKEELSVRLNNSLKQFSLSLEEAINTEPSKLKEIGFGNRSIIELQGLKQECKQERERGITITHANKQETLQQIDQNNPITRGSTALVYKQDPDKCKTPLDCGKVYNEELTTQTVTCTKCGNAHTFPFGGDYYCPSPKQETLQEVAERILANNIDGLRDALKDDDLFFFYKGVVQCYGEAMAEWQKENEKRIVSVSDLEDGYQQELFNYLHSELDVIALQSQMHDIERIVDSMPSKNIYSEEDMREMYNKSCGLIGLGKLNDQTENNNRFRELIEKIKNN